MLQIEMAKYQKVVGQSKAKGKAWQKQLSAADELRKTCEINILFKGGSAPKTLLIVFVEAH